MRALRTGKEEGAFWRNPIHREGRELENRDLIQRRERGCRGEQPHPQGKKRVSPANLACTPGIICCHIKSQKDNE